MKSLIFKIHRHYVLADASSEVGDFDVIRMDRVGIQRLAIAKHRAQCRVIRSGEMQDVEANGQTFDLFYD